jgi:hypothetical protein
LVGCGGDPCGLPGDSVASKPGLSRNEESNVNISLSTVVLSAELLEKEVVPMGQSDGVPVVVGYDDDEDEEDEEDDLDDDEDDEEDDEELDGEDLDHEWKEVIDEDDDEDADEEDEEEDEE